MKQVIILLTGIIMYMGAQAQTDSTEDKQNDTIRVGGMIIIKKHDRTKGKNDLEVKTNPRNKKSGRLSTNWWIVDLGFANYSDKTDYSAPATQAMAVGFTPEKDDFKLRPGKSVNVNIWAFMQKLNIISNVVNLKYGLGIELNNYRYREPVQFLPKTNQFTYDITRNYSKNKLAADYVTVPVMLNFNFTPNKKRGFGFSGGASAGYLYSSRQKTVTNIDGKEKERDDFNLRPWKLSYIGEVSLGIVKFYGSYAAKSMFEDGGLDQTPYNFGIRLSNW